MRASPAAVAAGGAFDEIADEYDRRRPAYPEELVAKACELAGLSSGDRVLEVGCGSGQLTRSLLERGLRVTAVEPGHRLLALAERKLASAGELELLHAPFELAQLPRGRFRAVFSASAFHWLDPDVSWQKAADVLAPGAALALIQYVGMSDEQSRADQEALLAALGGVAPAIAARWPTYRDLAATAAGVQQRAANISAAWSWLGGYELTRARAAELFGGVRMATVPVQFEQSAAELNALLGTQSFYAGLTAAQRQALEAETLALEQRLGRLIRSSTAAVVVAAQRR